MMITALRQAKNATKLAARMRGVFLTGGGIVYDREAMHLMTAWSSGRLPRCPLPEVFPGIQQCDSIALRKPQARTPGWSLDLQELTHVCSIIRQLNARRVLEIGTFDGFATLNMAANIGDGGMVYTVDLPPDHESRGIDNASDSRLVGAMFRGEPECSRITQLYADSMTADWSTFGGPFDLILVDGCHSYPYVKSDGLNAIRQIKPGGVVLWHDYGQFPEVSRAVDEIAETHRMCALIGTRFACYY